MPSLWWSFVSSSRRTCARGGAAKYLVGAMVLALALPAVAARAQEPAAEPEATPAPADSMAPATPAPAAMEGSEAMPAAEPAMPEPGAMAPAGPRMVVTTPNAELPQSHLPVADNALQLSLDDALTTALQRNLGLLVDRYDRRQFRLRIDEAIGIYDLGLNADVTQSSNSSPSTSLVTGAALLTTKTRRGTFSLDQLTPWGGAASVTTNFFRQESNSKDVPVNPIESGSFSLGVTQPLLRNFGRGATERGIRIARLNNNISRETFETQIAATLQSVENAYWDLVQARKNAEVADEGLRLAQDLHRMNQVRVQVGTLAPLELVQSEVGIATAQEQIITAQQTEQNAEDALRQLLHIEEGPLWDMPIVPTTSAETTHPDVDLKAAIGTAMSERPELRSQKLQVDLRALDAAYFRNQLMPRLDLTAGYGYNGGNTLVTTDSNTGQLVPVAGDFSDVWHQVRSRDFNGWSVELVLGYPLQNRTARAEKAIADVNLEQGKAQLDQLEESIRTEVRTAVRAVKTAAQEIESTTASVGLAEKNLDAEHKRYENGLSTSFQVLLIQQDLTSARSRQVAAIAGYRRALAAYYLATGKLLDAEGVELDDPQRVEHLDRFGWGVGGPAK